MTKAVSICGIVLAISLIATLVGGGLLHAVIPHTHGTFHTHDHADDQEHQEESAMWGDLHQAIHHEDKKVFAALVTMMSVDTTYVLNLLAAVEVLLIVMLLLNQRTFFDSEKGLYLMRGIAPYRRFT